MSRAPVRRTVQEAALKLRLIAILTSPAAQKIDFFLGYMHINGFGYQRVADALREGSIGVGLGNVPSGAAAAFDSDENLFEFPDGGFGLTLASDQGTIIHEATHAMKSLLYPFKVGWTVADTQDEAAAYVAGSLYMFYIGKSFTGAPGAPLVFVKADQIARSIQDQKAAIVSARDEGHLRAVVATDPLYSEFGINYYSLVYR